MINRIIVLSKQLISLKTVPENKKALDESLDLILANLNEYTIERFEKNGYKSALIYNKTVRPEKFTILLNGHVDVIPGKDTQYIPRIADNKLYGVGALDMKSNLVCLVFAFKEVAAKVDYPIALQIVTDEELGGFNGTAYQIEKGVRADFIITGETTNFDIVNKAKGIIWAKVSCTGQTAHGAYPWRGENAIWKMNDFLTILKEKFLIPADEAWVTTINLSEIKTSNNTFNKIPDDCEVSLDIRFIPSEENTILRDLEKLIPDDFKLEIISKEPAMFAPEDNAFIKKLQNECVKVTKHQSKLYGAMGSSDVRHFNKVGCVGVEFGAIGGGIGSDEEWIDIDSLEKYYEVLVNFLRSV